MIKYVRNINNFQTAVWFQITNNNNNNNTYQIIGQFFFTHGYNHYRLLHFDQSGTESNNNERIPYISQSWGLEPHYQKQYSFASRTLVGWGLILQQSYIQHILLSQPDRSERIRKTIKPVLLLCLEDKSPILWLFFHPQLALIPSNLTITLIWY